MDIVNGWRERKSTPTRTRRRASSYFMSLLPKQLVGFYAEKLGDAFHGGERKILARLDALEVARGGFE